ncbi:class I SAM-dependent methyltransferase [bacterium]|nr:class I SAM-dependent methyltransferase [bacterium]
MNSRVVDRIDFILDHVRGKKVLDWGCIDHDLFMEKRNKGIWLHHTISDVATKAVGVDILEEYIPRLRKAGYDIRLGDAEHLEELNWAGDEEFDVIVVGEVIEHLFNIGLFLDGVKRFFAAQTTMIITTPNPFTIRMLTETFADRETRGRDDHTCWYSERTLTNLLINKGFRIEELVYFSQTIKRKGIRPSLRRILYRKSPRFADGLIFVCSLPDKNAL